MKRIFLLTKIWKKKQSLWMTFCLSFGLFPRLLIPDLMKTFSKVSKSSTRTEMETSTLPNSDTSSVKCLKFDTNLKKISPAKGNHFYTLFLERFRKGNIAITGKQCFRAENPKSGFLPGVRILFIEMVFRGTENI